MLPAKIHAITGLSADDIRIIQKELSVFTEISSAIIFGSRAKGTYKQGSDVDICIKGENLSFEHQTRLSWKLNEETNFPWHFDILIYHTIKNKELKDHIDRVGLVLYP